MDDIDDLDLPSFDDVAEMVRADTVEDMTRQKSQPSATSADPTNFAADAASGGKNTIEKNAGTASVELAEIQAEDSREVAYQRLMTVFDDDQMVNTALDAAKADGAPNNVAIASAWIVSKASERNITSKPSTDAATGSQDTGEVDIESPAGEGNNTADNTTISTAERVSDGCEHCLRVTASCCEGCSGGFMDWMDGLGKVGRWLCLGSVGSVCCVGVLLAIILIPASLRKVEFDEYAVKYDGLTRQESSEEYGEGRYLFTPATYMFRYDALIQKVSLDLNTLTRDGVEIEVLVDVQYAIPKSSVYYIWDSFGKEKQIDKYFALVAADAVRDAIGSFPASAFYQSRFSIQLAIEDQIISALDVSNTGLILTAAIMTEYGYPEEMSTVIQEKRAIENDIEVAINERDGDLTDAATTLAVAKIDAYRLEIQGQAEVDSLLVEATAFAGAVTNRFEYITELFLENQQAHNYTAKEFVDYWLSSYVLWGATDPITNIGSHENVTYGNDADDGQEMDTPSSTGNVFNDSWWSTTGVQVANTGTTQYFTTTIP